MVLQEERQLVGMRSIRRTLVVVRGPQERAVVLDEHTVVEHRHARGREHSPTGVEARRVKHDVIHLPFSGRTARVDERRELSIDRRGLSVGIGDVLVRIEHLALVVAHEDDAAVATLLSLALRWRRCAPFDMKLHVAERASRLDRA